MKRELAAALLLLLLVAGAFFNLAYLGRFIGGLCADIEAAQEASSAGNSRLAAGRLNNALERWLAASPYTNIFIRHAELDTTTDAFYELLDAYGEESPNADAACEKLLYHLRCIYQMEVPTLGSVL